MNNCLDAPRFAWLRGRDGGADVEQLRMKIFGTHDANLIPETDWNAIQETRYLLSVPGMCESVKAGMAEPPQDLAKSLDW